MVDAGEQQSAAAGVANGAPGVSASHLLPPEGSPAPATPPPSPVAADGAPSREAPAGASQDAPGGQELSASTGKPASQGSHAGMPLL